jgi:uncharacterized oxidoreductase
MKLQQRTILITGGTSGIGLELARQLLGRGNTVIVTGRDQERLDEAQRALPGVQTFRSDVSDPSAIEALHKDVVARRVAPHFMFKQMIKLSQLRPKAAWIG